MKLKQWQNILHVFVNANLLGQLVIQIKNGITKHVNVNAKTIAYAKNIIVGILSYLFVSDCMWWSYICDIDIVSTKMENTIATNASINSYGKNVRYKIYCYILRIVLLAIILLLIIIIIICYHYARHMSKLKHIKH